MKRPGPFASPVVVFSALREGIMARLFMGGSKMKRDEAMAGYIALSPWFIGFLIFTLTPFAASLYFSFTDYDVLNPPEWVGWENYNRLFTRDRLFPLALRNTFIYALLYVPLHVISALGIAML